MVDMSKKDFFDVNKAQSQKGDPEWKEHFSKKIIRPYQRALRDAIEVNRPLRVQYLLETYPEKYQNLEQSESRGSYKPCHIVAMEDRRSADVLKVLLNKTDFTDKTQKTAVLKTGLLSSFSSYAETVFDYFQDHVSSNKDVQSELLHDVLCAGHDKSIALFIKSGVGVDDPEHQMLKKSIEHGHMNSVRMLVATHKASIKPEHISEAERAGKNEILGFLQATVASAKEKKFVKAASVDVPAQDALLEGLSKFKSTWEVMGDDIVMHIRNNTEGTIKITDLYDFKEKNVTRSQYLLNSDAAPTVTTTDIDALENAPSAIRAFNRLKQETAKDQRTAVGPSLLSLSRLKN